MFGPSIFSVFRSRWKAALWALGILITVWSIIPSANDGKAVPADDASAAAAIAGITGSGRMLTPEPAGSTE